MRKKILIVFDDYLGGAGNVAQMLANELSLEYDIEVLLMDKTHQPRYEYKNGIVEKTIRYKNKYCNVVFRLHDIIRQIRNVIATSNPNIIISFLDNNNTLVSFAMGRKRIPMIACERSNPVAIKPQRVWNYLRRLAYKKIEVISVQFEEFTKFDSNRFSSKCIVTPNIINTPPKIKDNWKYTGKFKFVSLGRFDTIKQFPLMIKMFDCAYKKNKEIELHIYGWGSEEDTILKCIQENNLENVVFLHERTEDIYSTLLQYDCYLLTSRQEGFPNALSEAMAVGLPSVSFECHKGIRELCRDGNAGICVNVGDEKAYVDSMLELAENEVKRSKLGEEAKKIVDEYSKERVLRKWKECIEKAAERNERTAGKS